MSKLDVRGMQARLVAAGHDPNGIDGTLGRGTLRALFNFCAAPMTLGERGRQLARAAAVHFPEYELLTPLRLAHFLAQASHETGGFKWMEEIWGPTDAQRRYEGRADLGNTQPGDGFAFKGRGIFQLTGRANYNRYSDLLGLDLIDEPRIAALPGVSVLIACQYWRDRNINRHADGDNIEAVTRAINGGLNGIDDRRARLARIRQVIGV